MKTVILTLLLTVLFIITQIDCRPGLYLQNEMETYHSGTTKLISKCDESDQGLLTLDYIKIDPEVFVRGQNITMELKGFLLEDIVSGSFLDVSMKIGMFPFLKFRFDFCDSVVEFGEACPFPKGDINILKDIYLPRNDICKLKDYMTIMSIYLIFFFIIFFNYFK
ncbi:unnamed protein product [Rhizopus stolonifer]